MSDKKCDLCGDPEAYKSWDKTALCRIHYENLLRDAQILNRELLLEREDK